VAREPLSGLPGLHLHLLVGRAVTFVGGLVPGIGEVVALVGGPLPGVVHGKAGDPLTLGLLDNLLGEVGHPPRELFSFLALAVVGEASKATTAMAAVAHPCSREEQR
jgi:hypothetical protein